MRLLHTADWHLGRSLEGRNRLDEQAAFLDELNDIVISEKVDAILMAGDVFDTVNPPAAAEQLFYENVARLSQDGNCPIFIIAGNHDNPDRLSASTPIAKQHGISILGYPTMSASHHYMQSCDQTLTLASLPYPSESRLHELLSEQVDEELLRAKYDDRIDEIFTTMSKQFNPKHVNIAMSHIYVAGSKESDSERPIQIGGAYTVAAESLPQSAQYVALGHLHRPQQIKRAKTMARYSGSPLAYSFSEAGYSKSVSIVDVNPNEQAVVNEVLLSSGKPLVRWKATEGLSQVYRWLDEKKDESAWIDLEIHLENALSLEEIHRLRKLRSGFIHIRPVFTETEEEEQLSKHANLPIDELFKRFYVRQTGGAEPETEIIQLFLDLIHDENDGEEDL